MIPITHLIVNTINKKKEEEFLNKRSQAREAMKFIQDYYSSPGFKERFLKVPKYMRNYYEDDNNDMMSYSAVLDPFVITTEYVPHEGGSFADLSNNSITLYDKDFSNYKTAPDYTAIAAHEYAHLIDDNIKMFERLHLLSSPDTIRMPKFESYSTIFPQFRKNREYLRSLSMMKPDVAESFLKYPEDYYNLHHDAMPSESYADLIMFRSALKKEGIYDSTKANNPFTQSHLDAWKKTGKPMRLLDNFDDDTIIDIMNEIAYNPNKDLKLYAKQGTKLIRKQ